MVADIFRERFDYEPESGRLIWKKRAIRSYRDKIWNLRYARTEAGWVSNHGYRNVRIQYDGKQRIHPAHRIIWAIVHGEMPDRLIDHIDGDGLNNRLVNLRLATQSQNSMNGKFFKDTRSGMKGVVVSGNKFLARIKVKGQLISLGTYLTKHEAARAYHEAAKKHFGEFARAGW